jgi:Tfp pilus assembly protein PilF
MKKTTLALLLGLFYTSVCAQQEIELNQQGIECAKKGEIEKAFRLFDQAIQINPNFSNAYSNRANVHRLHKKYDLAIKDYSKSLEINPTELRVLYSRANSFLENRNFENAIADYSSIINKQPDFENIYFDRAYAYIRLEDYAKAKTDLESQLKMAPKDFKSLANLINIKKKMKLYQEALADYQTIIEEFPNQSDLHILYNNRANLYQDLGEMGKALEDINHALQIKKSYAIGYLNRAELNLKLGKKLEACIDLKKAQNLGLEQEDHFKVDEDYTNLLKNCN